MADVGAGQIILLCVGGAICILVGSCILYCCFSQRRGKKRKKPIPKRKRRPPNVISHLHGSENLAGPQHPGITVTAASGVHYSQQQPPPGPATFQPTQLPPYLPSSNGQPYFHQGNGHVNSGYQLGQVAQPQQQRAFAIHREDIVASNPGGRGVRLAVGAGGGSIDTLNTGLDDTSSVLSFGSTGSYSSAASINNPMRSSLKKPKNKETASVASAASKKSVRIALGEEQTAV